MISQNIELMMTRGHSSEEDFSVSQPHLVIQTVMIRNVSANINRFLVCFDSPIAMFVNLRRQFMSRVEDGRGTLPDDNDWGS
jgi:hypothetical protein